MKDSTRERIESEAIEAYESDLQTRVGELDSRLSDTEVRLELAQRDRDAAVAALEEMTADRDDVAQAAEHWHQLAEGYVRKVAKIAHALGFIGGAESEAAESELRNATPPSSYDPLAVPHVEGLGDHGGTALPDSSVPRNHPDPMRGPGRPGRWIQGLPPR